MSIRFPPMSAEADDRAEIVFFQALKTPLAEREAFLNGECGTDTRLRAEVDQLLGDHEKAGNFLKMDAPVSAELEAEFARLKPEDRGERIANYKLLEKIGEGGFGVVWVAEQEKPVRRRVALKIIKLGMDTKEVIARFEQERQALAMMDHPNIAKVLDAGATPFGRPFFAMELVRGIKITEYCDQANLPTAERLGLFIAVCHAVQHAHQKGIIHRDLKPSNILVTLHDGVPVPKVIDFGVAKATQQQRLTDLTVYTQFEQMIGTPLYMSPEQAEMTGLDIDTRSDIYSLGVLLYELLVGRTPFDPEALMKAGYDEMRRVIREQEPQKPSTFVSTMALDVRTTCARRRQIDGAKWIGQIRGDLDWIVMKALEKDRTRRYETANGLANDIQRHLLSEPVQARPPSAGYRFRRWVKRNRTAVGSGAAVLLALLVGITGFVWQAVQTSREARRANAALSDLRNSAPAFAALSRTLMAKEDFDAAIEKLDIAIKLRPEVADYVLRKADLLQSQLRFGEAAPIYREVLKLDAGRARAETNATLCEKLAREAAAQPKLSQQTLAELFSAMTKEERSAAEMMRVGKLLGEENKLLLSYWAERLKDLPIAPENPLEKRLTIAETGLMSLDLSGTSIADLSQLKGMPLERLILTGCKNVTDLQPLSGMPLRHLFLRGSAFRDLSAVRGLRLVTLDIEGVPTPDLSPLSGMPLEWLNIRGTGVRDLAPLKGMPLKYLSCPEIKARDFSALAGARITELNINFNRIDDLSFLGGMPLKTLSAGCWEAHGFQILSQIPTLESLVLPNETAHLPMDELAAIAALRNHPALRDIRIAGDREDGTLGPQAEPKDRFWKKFDADVRMREALVQVGGAEARFVKLKATWMVGLENRPVKDLTPLQGAPISTLDLEGTEVADLTPLRGMRVDRLDLSGTNVTDLEPLIGSPKLADLRLCNTKVKDLTPLRNLKLKVLYLEGCQPGLDLLPLLDVPTLEELLLPPDPRNLDELRKLPNLKRLSFEYDSETGQILQSAEEFWSGKHSSKGSLRAKSPTAEILARQGKFADAETLLRERVERWAGLNVYPDWVGLAGVVLAQGDNSRYQALCKQIMENVGDLKPSPAAVVCLMGPNSGIGAQDLEKLMQELGSRNQAFSSSFLAGLHEYRAGRYAKAVKVLEPCCRTVASGHSGSAAAILSMAYYQEGKIEEATATLNRARAGIIPHWPGGSMPVGWDDWLVAYLQLQEAEKLIAGSGSAEGVKLSNKHSKESKE